MFSKFVTRLHEINESPKTRLILDFVFITLLTLVLVYCMIGVQGCLGSRTVYAAEEETMDLDFSEFDIPPLSISRDVDSVTVLSSNGMIWYFCFSITGDSSKCSLYHDNLGFFLVNNGEKDIEYSMCIKTYSYSSDSYSIYTDFKDPVSIPSGSKLKVAEHSSAINRYFCSSIEYSTGSNGIVQYTHPANFTMPERPLPPFSLESFASDYISLITASIIDVFVAFADFCVESPVVIASIALSFIGYAIVKARDSVRGV